jgi:hypothetical protein
MHMFICLRILKVYQSLLSISENIKFGTILEFSKICTKELRQNLVFLSSRTVSIQFHVAALQDQFLEDTGRCSTDLIRLLLDIRSSIYSTGSIGNTFLMDPLDI